MRARPRGPEHRPARDRRRQQGVDGAAAVSRPVQGAAGRPRLRDRHRGVPRRRKRSRLHRQSRADLRRQDRNPLRPARSKTVRARRHLRYPQSRRHRRRPRRRLARTDRRARQPRPQRRHPAARQPRAAGPRRQIAEARRAHRQNRTHRRRPAQGRPRPHLLCGRRHLARAGAHPHPAERLSAAGDARLFATSRGSTGFRAPPAPAGGGQHACRYRSRRRRAASAADLCRAGARIHHPRRAAEDDRVLDLRRARRPALRNAAAAGARQGRLHLRRTDVERLAVTLRAPCRGTGGLDRPVGSGGEAARELRKTAACAMPPVCCPTSAGGCIPITAARKR